MSNKYVFTDEDYNSGDGMMTSVWGPPLWHTLHTISFNYPINPTEDQKKHYLNFYSSLQYILPCKFCRDNLANNLKQTPLTIDVFKNRESLSCYVYNLHEMINTLLGKTSGLSYEDVRDRYEHFRSRCINNPNKINNKDVHKEKGCTEPLYGLKSKCILNIVPRDNRYSSFKIDPKCILRKNSENRKSLPIFQSDHITLLNKQTPAKKSSKTTSKKSSSKKASSKAPSKKASSKTSKKASSKTTSKKTSSKTSKK